MLKGSRAMCLTYKELDGSEKITTKVKKKKKKKGKQNFYFKVFVNI